MKKEKTNAQKTYNILIYSILATFICLAFFIGFFIGKSNSNSYKYFDKYFTENDQKYNKIDSLLFYIDNNFVDSIYLEDLVDNTINSVLDGLDPHSYYIPEEESEELTFDSECYFNGIGAEFIELNNKLIICDILGGSPAYVNNIKKGDEVINIDSVTIDLKKNSIQEILAIVKNKDKENVNLTLFRNDTLLDINLKKSPIIVSSIDASFIVDDKIGYIKIRNFSETTYFDFLESIRALQSKGADSFIIDLRDNPGGHLSSAENILNEFLNNGDLMFYTKGKNWARINYVADGYGRLKKNKIAILINENSASASEVLAGAIQDLDRGIIIGTRSFGKGLIQQQFNFNDNSSIRLSVAKYYTPSGRSPQKPYLIGENSAYIQNIIDEYTQGKSFDLSKIDTTQLPIYKSKNGNRIYGNVGIVPNIIVNEKENGFNSYSNKLLEEGIVQKFAVNYAIDNIDKLDKYKDWLEMIDFLKTQNLSAQLSNFAFSEKRIRPKASLITNSSSLLEKYIIAYIVKYLYSDKSIFYQILLNGDPVLTHAVENIEDN